MKNLFKLAFVAFALTAFTACNEEAATTETEAVETEVVTEEEVITEEEVVVEDTTATVVEEAPATEVQ